MKTLILFIALVLSSVAFGQYSDTASCNGGLLEFEVDYDQQTCTGACNGNYNINILNGVGPYTYSITGPSAYTHATSIDSNLCDGSYSATVTDVGQSLSCSITFTVLALSPNISFITNSFGTGNSPCNGIASISLSGGVPPYSYQWYDATFAPLVGQTTNMIDSMCAGTYYVKYWDATPPCGLSSGGVGNVGSGFVAIVIPYEPIVITMIFSASPPCPNMPGQFMYSISGGSGNYTSTFFDPVGGTGPAAPNVLMYSSPGFGNINVVDDAGNSASLLTSIADWPFVDITPIPTNETCSNACDGSFFFNDLFSPGFDLYSIDGGITYQLSPYFYNLCPGNYVTYGLIQGPVSGVPECPLYLGDFAIAAGNPISYGTDMQTHCQSFIWTDGITYTSNNNSAIDTLTNGAGCDSIVTLDLTILNATNGIDIQTACDSLMWIDGNTYTTNNNSATWILTNAVGCDSVVTLDLTITQSTSGSETINTCAPFTWSASGLTYPTSGIYTTVLTNAAGCDSLVTLNLFIGIPTSSTQDVATCYPYAWPVNGVTYLSSGTYTTTITNTSGCDSLMTLNLTVNQDYFDTIQQTACISYTWPVDGQTYYGSGLTSVTLTSSAGCDSVLVLDLTINTVNVNAAPTGDITLSANTNLGTYQWVDCDNNYAPIAGETNKSFTAVNNGNYAVIITQSGCSDTSECFLISQVGLIENDFGSLFKVYPNPTHGKLKIDLGAEYVEITTKVFDAKGKLISEHSYSDRQSFELVIAGVHGIYFLEILTDDGSKARIEILKE